MSDDKWQVAIARHKEWEALQKQRHQLQNPAFRKWLEETDPDTYDYVTTEVPKPEDVDKPTGVYSHDNRPAGSSNRPEDYE